MRKYKPLALIGAEVGEGASDCGCKRGAQALRDGGLAAQLAGPWRDARWADMVTARPAREPLERLDSVARFSVELARVVERVLRRGDMPVVVGGDHSCAVGTWSAVADAWRDEGDIGLVWIDAHLDAHTPASSNSLAPHGMPVAALLGYGAPGLTALHGWAGKVKPGNLAIIGARSFEAGERALLERLGVRVMFMPEVERRGFQACFDEALALVRRRTVAWGLSFDLDALDPADAPGTGTPVDAGIALVDAVQALRGCAADPACAAIELTEYNPLRDVDGRTARSALALLSSITGAAEVEQALAA
jgi:arginase